MFVSAEAASWAAAASPLQVWARRGVAPGAGAGRRQDAAPRPAARQQPDVAPVSRPQFGAPGVASRPRAWAWTRWGAAWNGHAPSWVESPSLSRDGRVQKAGFFFSLPPPPPPPPPTPPG